MVTELFIGLMSGTSLDGVDVALVEFSQQSLDGRPCCNLVATGFSAYDITVRADLLKLHSTSVNELEHGVLMANRLAVLYAGAIKQLLDNHNIDPKKITAIGCHGQTIRHRPELGFTVQIANAALLAELSGIDVIADFRSRDIAAGGQGAPLVPAFHQAVFSDSRKTRIIVNIGGIANLTVLPADGLVIGFDSGPGNMLLDAWAMKHLGKTYDDSGKWAASGNLIDELLQTLLSHRYFKLPPPKSTGRELFNLEWLEQHLKPDYRTADVQRTLLELTATSIAAAIISQDAAIDQIYICGGGAHNQTLLARLQQLLHPASIALTDELGISADWVEAAAFAWLAKQTTHRKPGNLAAVTGAKGPRVLGAIYPA